MNKWYADAGVNNSVIISSRVRIARNIKKYPFPARLGREAAEKMIGETVSAIKNERTPLGDYFDFININENTDVEKRAKLEKHIVSPEFLKNDNPKGLLLQRDEKVSIMINEEDHIRIQSINAGNGIDSAWDIANKIDDLIEEAVEYAFDKDLGYLTSCPTNTGTGLRASFMVHLPMLERTGQLRVILSAVSKFGMTLRGIYGEGTEPLGGIYQISNQITMGKSEQDIISSLKRVTEQIIEKESTTREKLFSEHKIDMEDRVYRSFGILQNCRKITAKEAMDLLSELRLGYLSHVANLPNINTSIYGIMMSIQPGNLISHAKCDLTEYERDIYRADFLRDMFR